MLPRAVFSNEGRWSVLPNMPLKVQEIYPVLHREMIVVAGGLYAKDNGQLDVSKRVVAFDLNEGHWQDLAELPEPIHHPYLVSLNNQLYAFSGFVISKGGQWTASKKVLMLNEQRNQWKQVSEMPHAMCETVAAVNGDNIHFAGGRKPIAEDTGQWRDHSDIDSHLIFNSKTRQWSQAPSIPNARNSAASVVVNDQWFVIAGRTVAGGNMADVQRYDFEKKRWSKCQPLPQAQGGLAAAAIGNDIYVFGGEYFNNGGGVYKEVWRYDTTGDKWQQVSTMPVPRHGLGALSYNDAIYVIGGAAKVGGRDTTNRLSLFKP
jgi:N-acetylneuraminic acid mutarotase